MDGLSCVDTVGAGSVDFGVFTMLFSTLGTSIASTGLEGGAGVGASLKALPSVSASISASKARICSCNFAYCSSSSRMPLIVSSLNFVYSTSNIARTSRRSTRCRSRAIWILTKSLRGTLGLRLFSARRRVWKAVSRQLSAWRVLRGEIR